MRKDEDRIGRYICLASVWRKEKVLIACLVAILASALVLCYKPFSDRWRSVVKRAEVHKIMNEYWKPIGGDFRVKGPLATAQVEKALFGTPLDSEEARQTYESTGRGEAWGRTKAKWKDGDEFYFFTSDKRSWSELRGRQGYVLIRKKQVVDVMLTRMN